MSNTNDANGFSDGLFDSVYITRNGLTLYEDNDETILKRYKEPDRRGYYLHTVEYLQVSHTIELIDCDTDEGNESYESDLELGVTCNKYGDSGRILLNDYRDADEIVEASCESWTMDIGEVPSESIPSSRPSYILRNQPLGTVIQEPERSTDGDGGNVYDVNGSV